MAAGRRTKPAKASRTRTSGSAGSARAARARAAAARAPGGRTARRAADRSPEAVARRIVRATERGDVEALFDLYDPACVSEEATGEPARGLEAIRRKIEAWGSMVPRATWKARNVFVRPGRIAIEWEAELELLDGRKVPFREVAVHEIRRGKIVAERYYYDPSIVRQAELAARARAGRRGPTPPPDPMDL